MVATRAKVLLVVDVIGGGGGGEHEKAAQSNVTRGRHQRDKLSPSTAALPRSSSARKLNFPGCAIMCGGLREL